MKQQVYLGFDYGKKNIGVAVGHAVTELAQPLISLKTAHSEPPWAEIARLINEWKPDALIIGLPLNMDGSENTMTEAAREFGKHLHERYNVAVTMVDERLTTNAALDKLTNAGVPSKRHRQKKDMLAAQIILQSFLTEPPRGRQ